jgi:cytochrome c oxidase subunit 2
METSSNILKVRHSFDWNYEYSDYVTDDSETIVVESFMKADDDLELGELRALTVDNYLVLPINTSIRVLCTSNDVIHAFAVPSIGVKADCYPGRLNSLGFVINRESVYYGGCSELCGSLHHAMPIGVRAVPLSSYLSFIQSVSE